MQPITRRIRIDDDLFLALVQVDGDNLRILRFSLLIDCAQTIVVDAFGWRTIQRLVGLWLRGVPAPSRAATSDQFSLSLERSAMNMALFTSPFVCQVNATSPVWVGLALKSVNSKGRIPQAPALIQMSPQKNVL